MFEIYYDEGPGTSHYKVAEFATIQECEVYKRKHNTFHAVWTIKETTETELDRTVESDPSEVIDEPNAYIRGFFQHVYFTAREDFEDSRALDFARAFIRKYSGASDTFIWKQSRHWNMTGEIS